METEVTDPLERIHLLQGHLRVKVMLTRGRRRETVSSVGERKPEGLGGCSWKGQRSRERRKPPEMTKSLREGWATCKYYFFLILILHYFYCSSLLGVVPRLEEGPTIYLRACSGGLRWRIVQVKGGLYLLIGIRPSI